MGCRSIRSPGTLGSGPTWSGPGRIAIERVASSACRIVRGRVGRRRFPPEVALHLVHRACELPEQAGRSLSQWDCTELARQLVRDAVVMAISPRTVQRMLAARRLKPWRHHVWLHPRPRRVATRPARPGRPIQVEHEYKRAGATHLFAAFDTRSGRVYGLSARRKRQVEYLALLEHLDRSIPAA